jgi:SAM-dependent methyltransferase
MMPYQTTDIPGDSDSQGKWEALQIPATSIMGKRCLDLGCDEGYFCRMLRQSGARYCLGIDHSEASLDAARRRAGDGERDMQQYYWADIAAYLALGPPPDEFDLVVLASTYHYLRGLSDPLPVISDPVLDSIVDYLTPGGLLVWEGGVADTDDPGWLAVRRLRDTVIHPTRFTFEQLLAVSFDRWRCVGRSVQQTGDPISRWVYHAWT